MGYDCSNCGDGLGSDGNPCRICGGSGIIELTDPGFAHFKNKWELTGQIWDTIITAITTLQSDVTAIKAKLDTLDTQHDVLDSHLDAIENKIDALCGRHDRGAQND